MWLRETIYVREVQTRAKDGAEYYVDKAKLS